MFTAPEVEADQAHQKINNIAGGIHPPTWASGANHAAAGDSTCQGELDQTGLPGRSAQGVDAGVGERTVASAQEASEAGSVHLFDILDGGARRGIMRMGIDHSFRHHGGHCLTWTIV